MSLEFEYSANPVRIIFGQGVLSRTSEIIEALGCHHALVLATNFQKTDAETLATEISNHCVGVLGDAAMHTPTNVTENALAFVNANDVDCLVVFGGGSTTGLSKAISYQTDLPQIAIPTSYASSEVTSILGQTADGKKTTLKNSRVLPVVVLFDPELSRGLTGSMGLTSGINAIAHAAEALYAKDRNPMASLMAVEGINTLTKALPAIVENPTDMDAQNKALYGPWLWGSVLGDVGVALHHKLCHTLGGIFDLPRAETYADIPTHAIAFNAAEVTDLLSSIAAAFGHDKPELALFEFAKDMGAPTTLKECAGKTPISRCK